MKSLCSARLSGCAQILRTLVFAMVNHSLLLLLSTWTTSLLDLKEATLEHVKSSLADYTLVYSREHNRNRQMKVALYKWITLLTL
jgi:hypothetical protein